MGAPKDDTCLSRWTGCGHNPNACCDGMVCKEDDNNYLMCLPKNLIGTKAPTSKPTSKPTSMPTNKPTISVVVSTDEPTTLSPTLSTTTNNPTAKETEPSTTFSPTAKTTTLSDVPTDTPTATPTEYPTFLPTKMTLEPTNPDTTFEPTTTESCMDDPELSLRMISRRTVLGSVKDLLIVVNGSGMVKNYWTIVQKPVGCVHKLQLVPLAANYYEDGANKLNY